MISELSKIALNVKNSVEEFLKNDYFKAREILKMGADGTPTSKIDQIAEDQVFKYVIENDLPFNILSEEYGFLDRKYDKTLILDPLDGSFNAEMNIPFYSISMAIGKKDLMDVEIGFIMNLVTGKSYWAEKGKGAYFEGRKLYPKKNHDEILSIMSIGKNSPDSIWKLIKNSRRVRSLGCASLEMALVADGTADLFIYYFKNREILRVIDIAASTIIVREAGGEVYDLNDFSPLNMPLNLSVRKNALAVGDKEFLENIRRQYL